MKTLAIMHQAQTSGPSKTLRPSLERLAEHGPVELIVPAPGGRPTPGSVAAAYAGLAYVSALSYRPLTVPRGPLAAGSGAARLIGQVGAFRRRLRSARPDLVVVATAVLPQALIAARLERIPTIVRVAEIFEKGHIDGAARSVGGAALRSATMRLAGAIVCSSNSVAAQFAGARVPVITIYPGISLEHAAGDGAGFRRAHDLADARPLVAVVGNITPARGQDVAIRALPELARRHSGARLAIVGAPHARSLDRDYARSLRRLAEAEHVIDRVAFTGFVERVADVYAAADLVLNPARFNEPFGRAPLEGLVAGCGVVATRVGAVPEVLRDGEDSILVEPDNPEAIAAALAVLADDPRLAARMAKAGGERVASEYGTDRVADDFERVALDLVALDRARARGSD